MSIEDEKKHVGPLQITNVDEELFREPHPLTQISSSPFDDIPRRSNTMETKTPTWSDVPTRPKTLRTNTPRKKTKFMSTKTNKKSPSPQEIADELQKVLDDVIFENGLSVGNILSLVANLMHTAGKYRTLSGKDKKQMVVILINEAIEDQIEDENLEDFLQMMVTHIVPDAIDLLVDVSKKKYKFKSISKIFTKCCS